jgi:NADH:ubiquinone oxidoreductase subunit E
MVDDHDELGGPSDSGFFGVEHDDGATALDPAVVELVDELVAHAPAGRDGLLRVLLGVQRAFDRVSWRVQELVADRYRLSAAQVAGVVSFYPELSAQRRSRVKLDLCAGTGCWLRGSAHMARMMTDGLEDGREADDGTSIAVSRRWCMGMCGLGPVARFQGRAWPLRSEGAAADGLASRLENQISPEDDG